MSNSPKAIVYGGPSPFFVRFHSFLGILVFLSYLVNSELVMKYFLKDKVPMNDHVVLFSRLYGVLGLIICIGLFFEPILSRIQSLLHGLLAIAISVIVVHNRSLIERLSVLLSLYYAFVGVYLVIRSPRAVKIPLKSNKESKTN